MRTISIVKWSRIIVVLAAVVWFTLKDEGFTRTDSLVVFVLCVAGLLFRYLEKNKTSNTW